MPFFIILILSLLIILVIGLINFNHNVSKEVNILFRSSKEKEKRITIQDIDHLPKLLKNYIIKTRILGKYMNSNLVLKQKGRIRSGKSKKWMSFKATQYFSWKHPGFIWKAKSFPILVRDKYLNDIGEMKINLLGLKSIETSSGDKINQGALLRYLGELSYYPHGFLDDRIIWEEINSKTIKGILTIKGTSVAGFFSFNVEGFITSFKAERYKTNTLEKFIGVVSEYKSFEDMILPSKMKAIWNLKEGDFEYFNATIIDYKLLQ